jgi:hypothetical protein
LICTVGSWEASCRIPEFLFFVSLQSQDPHDAGWVDCFIKLCGNWDLGEVAVLVAGSGVDGVSCLWLQMIGSMIGVYNGKTFNQVSALTVGCILMTLRPHSSISSILRPDG